MHNLLRQTAEHRSQEYKRLNKHLFCLEQPFRCGTSLCKCTFVLHHITCKSHLLSRTAVQGGTLQFYASWLHPENGTNLESTTSRILDCCLPPPHPPMFVCVLGPKQTPCMMHFVQALPKSCTDQDSCHSTETGSPSNSVCTLRHLHKIIMYNMDAIFISNHVNSFREHTQAVNWTHICEALGKLHGIVTEENI